MLLESLELDSTLFQRHEFYTLLYVGRIVRANNYIFYLRLLSVFEMNGILNLVNDGVHT